MRMLVILYNKLNEINFTKGNDFRSLTALLKRMDEHIMGKCLILVVEDLNRVAKRKAQTSLTQIFACLDLPKLPTNRDEILKMQQQKSVVGVGFGVNQQNMGALQEGKPISIISSIPIEAID